MAARSLALLSSALLLVLGACDAPAPTSGSAPPSEASALDLDAAGERFVKLALELGQYDGDYVDAYSGPAEWAEMAESAPRSLTDLGEAAAVLASALEEIAGDPSATEETERRRAAMAKAVRAMRMRIAMAGGDYATFDEETAAIYDATAPEYDLAEFDAVLAEIDALVPGEAPLAERVSAFRTSLAIPVDKLSEVFDAAIAECRARTLEYIDLPETESFSLEFVTDQPWSGYNWYQGDYESLIQVNTDFPIIIDRAVDLGCHEGYPGHHARNILVERELLEARGWIEYSVLPLFSPDALISEGTANHGIDLAFPGDQKIAFERTVLFPLAGLDPADADKLDALNALRRKLSHAGNMVARRYLDGELDRDAAIELQQKYALTTPERAAQRIAFVEKYRGYVINYNLGRDIVEAYVEAVGEDDAARWAEFEDLLTNLKTASDLVE